MKDIIKFGYQLDEPINIVLGFFDGVHLGHRKIIEGADKMARSRRDAAWKVGQQEDWVQTAALTFDGSPYGDDTLIYTFEERVSVLRTYYVISSEFSGAFKNLSAEQFLKKLNDTYDIRGIVCGADYRFGAGAKGDVALLTEFCKQENIELKVFDLIEKNGVKVSSSYIRELLRSGEMEKANRLLGAPYFINGTVTRGRGDGKRIGFPTANIHLPPEKLRLKAGVYVSEVVIEDECDSRRRFLWGKNHYRAVTNYGDKPTFNDETFTVETHILQDSKGREYDGDPLYGKNVTVKILSYIRPVQRFDSADALKERIAEDAKIALEYK